MSAVFRYCTNATGSSRAVVQPVGEWTTVYRLHLYS